MLKTRISTLSLVVFFSIILLIGIISSSSYASVQQQSQQSNQFPSTIIAASSSDTASHALKLKATQPGEEGEPRKVRGFKIDLTNVVTAQINS
jgi:hypothetical protein